MVRTGVEINSRCSVGGNDIALQGRRRANDIVAASYVNPGKCVAHRRTAVRGCADVVAENEIMVRSYTEQPLQRDTVAAIAGNHIAILGVGAPNPNQIVRGLISYQNAVKEIASERAAVQMKADVIACDDIGQSAKFDAVLIKPGNSQPANSRKTGCEREPVGRPGAGPIQFHDGSAGVSRLRPSSNQHR